MVTLANYQNHPVLRYKYHRENANTLHKNIGCFDPKFDITYHKLVFRKVVAIEKAKKPQKKSAKKGKTKKNKKK